MTYTEEEQTQQLGVHGIEPASILGTIEEGREGSISGDSEEGLTTQLTDRPIQLALSSTYSKSEGKKTLDSENFYSFEEDDPPSLKTSHSDVDGGWAIVVWICVFLLFAITSGLLNVTGIFYVRMLEVFGHSRSYTAWMGSLINAFFMLGGPLSSIFIQNYGCRASLMLGSLVMTVGYLLSAVVNSLQLLFFTYGIIVACGMNLCYSGEIIALAQYFHKYHSLATSTAMAGIGVGMFAFGKIFEYCIEEYGWRPSFVIAAGFALQNMVLGALIFPLPSSTQYASTPSSTEELHNLNPSEENNLKPIFSAKNLINRSVSSLLLSAEGGYLSHSILNLNQSRSNSRFVPADFGLKSNHASFCSRNSQFGVMSLKSNPYSFYSKDGEPHSSGLKSNNHSFSRKHSFADTGLGRRCNTNPYSMKSSDSSNSICNNNELRKNRNSFSSKESYLGMNMVYFTQNNQHPLTKEGWKETSIKEEPVEVSKKCFTIHNDCNLSCCTEEDLDTALSSPECEISPNEDMEYTDSSFGSLCYSLFSFPSDHPLRDVRLWFMSTGVFFCMLGTLLMFVIYKDLCDYLGVAEYYTTCLCMLGVGDIIGRISGGILASFDWAMPILFYSAAILICAGIIGCYTLVFNGAGVVVISLFFGIIFGGQNVLLAVAPNKAFGREKLATVFGYILFMGGLGALFGAPLAGWIVDATGSFIGVITVSAGNCVTGSLLMFCCFVINQRRAVVPLSPNVV